MLVILQIGMCEKQLFVIYAQIIYDFCSSIGSKIIKHYRHFGDEAVMRQFFLDL
jgi:hypothetical protein